MRSAEGISLSQFYALLEILKLLQNASFRIFDKLIILPID
jgi:hypothetical protein